MKSKNGKKIYTCGFTCSANIWQILMHLCLDYFINHKALISEECNILLYFASENITGGKILPLYYFYNLLFVQD